MLIELYFSEQKRPYAFYAWGQVVVLLIKSSKFCIERLSSFLHAVINSDNKSGATVSLSKKSFGLIFKNSQM